MTLRISSLPPRDQLFQPRDLVTSAPKGAPGTESASKTADSGAVIVDLTPGRSRETANKAAAAAKAVATANAEAASVTSRDMKSMASLLRDAARQSPGLMMAAQGAPDAGRVASVLLGD